MTGSRIVHLIGQLGRGGAEKQVVHVARALSSRGWPQSVISFSLGGVWKSALGEAGIPVWEIAPRRARVLRLWRLYQVIHRVKPAVAISWSPHAAVYLDWVVGKVRPRTVFNVRADLTVDSNSGARSNDLVTCRKALQRADYVVSNADFTLNVLRREGVTFGRSRIVRNIVEARGRGVWRPRIAELRIVTVGTLNRRKAYDVLLRALGILAREDIRFRLSMAGDGPERECLAMLAQELGIREYVEFLGDVQSGSDVIATGDVFVHPSRSEGLSNAILEAMAEGIAVIATPVGGSPEVIRDGESGVLVQVDDVAGLAVALRRLARDDELRQRLGAAGLEFIRELCSEDAVATAYENVLREVLAGIGKTA